MVGKWFLRRGATNAIPGKPAGESDAWPAPWFIGDYPEIVGMNRIETSSD
jgi:hypothetical protein